MENENNCLNCEHLCPCGDGDHICDNSNGKIVLIDYLLYNDFFWCKGKKWKPIQ